MWGSRTPRRLRFGPFRIISRAVIAYSFECVMLFVLPAREPVCPFAWKAVLLPCSIQPPNHLAGTVTSAGKQHHEKQDGSTIRHKREQDPGAAVPVACESFS